MSQPTFLELIQALASEYLDSIIVAANTATEPDETRALREEYGELLLAEQAKVEALEAELAATRVERDTAQLFAQQVTNTLHRCYEASRILRLALEGEVT